MKQYSVSGMHCAACSLSVEKAVRSVQGVTDCTVSLLTNSMRVEGSADPKEVIGAVKKAGYSASIASNKQAKSVISDGSEDNESSQILKRLLVSLFFLLILMYFTMGHAMLGLPVPSFFADDPLANSLLQLLLTVTVMVINQRFFTSGVKALLHRSPNMDTLVSLGAAAAFGYSTVLLFLMADACVKGSAEAAHYAHDMYFESAAMILTLITFGKLLEARAKGKTTDAIKSLMKLSPQTAIKIIDGVETEVPIEEVSPGDLFAVKPGAQIPVDGKVNEGIAAVDESMLSGESIPVEKQPGDRVSAGTINRSGYLVCTATKVGEDTTLSEIIRMVSDAAATKAPIAKLADKVAGVFVPVVIGIALIAFIVWLICGQTVGFALARGISVLVISCPCALGLATPVAIMVGSGLGAKHGILFKTAAALEATGKTEIVVFDKTGTLTMGQPEVTDLFPADSTDDHTLLEIAATLEQHSEHPLAAAVMRKAADSGILPRQSTDLQVRPGNGLTANSSFGKLSGGNLAFILSESHVNRALQDAAHRFASEGKTPLFFAVNGQAVGVIAVADKLKYDAQIAVKTLQRMGLYVVMLTGDNSLTARAVGESCGVDKVIAGVRPDGKAEYVRKMQNSGRVLMVGDGINDAPALTAADIGMAIGAGTDVAIDAAKVVLMHSSLSDVPAAIRLSRQVRLNIKENLFWAFLYNCIGIPLAAGALIPLFGLTLNPMFGAAAMSLSSFCVVTNALRLNFFKLNDFQHIKNKKRSVTELSIENPSKTVTLKIEGMMCMHCENRVKKALEAVSGVISAAVSHEKGTAVVTANEGVSVDVLKKAVEDADYTVLGIE
ncbi:MAG: heavy metal translocating P-type ATPase [Clostridia bacterium]|nr:heavy metal translocating P-type ATPase [Clostridia bacterium]